LISELISSPNNPRVRFAASLRDPKDRRRESRILIDGAKNIAIALRSGIRCTDIFICQRAWEASNPALREILPHTEPELYGKEPRRDSVDDSIDDSIQAVRWTRLTEQPMQKLQYGDRELQAIAVAVMPSTSLESLADRLGPSARGPERELYLVLDRFEKPGNLGAALRTADAAGATAVLVSDPISEVWNPNAIRASLGAMFTVPIAVASSAELRKWLRERSICCYAARTENGSDYSQVRFAKKSAIIIGSEAYGLEDRWKSEEITPIHIPMYGKIDSLNASVTCSILLFELIRQWQSA
jgi:TrmH family RNA methyltransferase